MATVNEKGVPVELAGTSNFPKPQRAEAKRAIFVGDLCSGYEGKGQVRVPYFEPHAAPNKPTWLKNAKRVRRPAGPLLLIVPEMLKTSPGEKVVWLGFGVKKRRERPRLNVFKQCDCYGSRGIQGEIG